MRKVVTILQITVRSFFLCLTVKLRIGSYLHVKIKCKCSKNYLLIASDIFSGFSYMFCFANAGIKLFEKFFVLFINSVSRWQDLRYISLKHTNTIIEEWAWSIKCCTQLVLISSPGNSVFQNIQNMLYVN